MSVQQRDEMMRSNKEGNYMDYVTYNTVREEGLETTMMDDGDSWFTSSRIKLLAMWVPF